MTAVAPLVRVEGLHIAYRPRAGGGAVRAVAGVSFAVQPGEVVAIVGESGSGKTTTAAALIGLLAANASITAGTVTLDGQDVTRAGEKLWRGLRGRRVGYVPQDPGLSLDPIRRIGSQVAEALTVHGVPAPAARRRVDDILESAGLTDPRRIARSFPHQLSGGMRQRVLIGIALANNPALIIADEPTSALDVTVQRQVLDHMQRLIRQKSAAMLLITHDLGIAFERADRLIVMQHGRVVEAGPARTVFGAPRHGYTMTLLAAASGFAAASPGRRVNPRPDMTASPLIAAEGLVKQFDTAARPAVDGVSFSVPRHGTTSIVGESGSGKSTTARMMLCLEKPTSGQVWFDGRDVTHLPRPALRDFRRRVQVVYQNPYTSLNPRLTVEEIIAEPLRAFRLGDRRARQDRVVELLERVELPARLRLVRPGELSGGQRQRVALARALAIRPELVVLDEPVSALDVSVQAQMLTLLQRLQDELGVSYLLISHDLAVVRQVSDYVVVLRAGRIVEQGPAETIFTAPAHAYTRALLKDAPQGGSTDRVNSPGNNLSLFRSEVLT